MDGSKSQEKQDEERSHPAIPAKASNHQHISHHRALEAPNILRIYDFSTIFSSIFVSSSPKPQVPDGAAVKPDPVEGKRKGYIEREVPHIIIINKQCDPTSLRHTAAVAAAAAPAPDVLHYYWARVMPRHAPSCPVKPCLAVAR